VLRWFLTRPGSLSSQRTTRSAGPRRTRHNGTPPVPVWSSNRRRFRLSRTGNRQLNAALHRIAITQAHYHPQARELLQRRRATGDTKTESIRVLKRRLSDVVYRALLADVDRADTLTKATCRRLT
jgi:transposase